MTTIHHPALVELAAVLAVKPAANFIVERSRFDASRPFAVVATFRSFNTVFGRYESWDKASRRARDLNKRGI